MVKRSDHSTSSTDKEVVADQAAKLKAKDAPLGQLQDVLPGTEIGWVATEVEGAQLPDVGMQPAADTPQASATVDSDLSVVTDAEATQTHVEQLGEPVTEAAALSSSASSSGIEQMAGASAWLGYGGDEVGEQAGAGGAQSGLVGNDFTVTPLPSAGSTPAVNVHVGVDGGTPPVPQALSRLTASGDTTGQLREDGQQIASGQLSTAGASGAVSWQLDHSAGLYGQLQLSGDGHWRYTLDNASSRVQGLCAGEQVSEHFIAAVTDSAGRTQFIPLTIAIDGSADRAIISGTDVGQANEDKLLLVSGMLTVQDADAGQAQFKPSVLTGSFGLLTLDTVGHWVYELDNANPAVQALGAGKAVTDVLTVTSVDGTTHQVTITVHGSNDQALIVGTHSGAVSEDSLLSVQGLLNVTDIDQGEARFVPQTLAGTFGQLQLDTAGRWTYLLDNTNPAVQALGAGAAATDTLTVTTLDGTPQQITITIKGSNDAAQIAGTLTGAVTEESTLIAKGTLTVTDVDQGQAGFNPEVFNGQYGSFSLDATGHWLYVLDNSNAAVQGLAAGEQVRDVMTVTSVDGTSCQLVVSVNGSNDAPVLTAQSQTVTEDGTRLSGRMVATDVDTSDTHVFSTANAVDGFTLNADGSYSFDPSNAAYQHLAAGQTQDVVIPVTVTDSAGATSTQNLNITVTGTNDAAVVGGRLTNTLTEDSVVSTGGMLRAGGQLTVVDPDAGEAVFVVQAGVAGVGHYGSFSIDASGHYSYIADNTQAAIQRLKAGEMLTDRFTVATADGTQQVVTITINGAEDRPVLQAQTHAVTEDGARLTGQMLATDVDAGDTKAFSTATQVAGFTLNADGSYSFDPSNAAYQHLVAGQMQDVVIPVTVTDSAGATSTQNLTITVTGINDAAVISGVSSGTITEDQSVQGGQLQASGQLTVADVDTGENHFIVQTDVAGSSGLGHFNLDATGAWTYTADNTQTAIQQLKAGESLTDMLSVTSADGATHSLTVTIQGSNDVSVLTAQTQAVTEDGAQLQGRMVATDVDAGDTHSFSTGTAVAGFTLSADGSYSFDPSNAAYQHLVAGQTQDVVIPVTVTDSAGATSTQNLTITVTGSNDGATIAGVNTGATVEDKPQAVTGQLTIADVDDGQAHFVAQSGVAGTYGTFTLNEQGQWNYQLDNSKPSVQALKTGDSVTDSFTLTSADGTAHQVTVTVTGKDDGAVIGGADTAVVSEDGNVNAGHLDATGQLTIIDPDAGQSQFIAQTATPGTYGEFTVDATGAWHYQANNSRTDIQQLKVGEWLTDTLTVTSTDGTTHQIQITINGTNDAPTLTAQAQAVTEDGARLTGHMVATDVDRGDTQTYSTQNPPAGFTLNADGSYSFDPSNAAYQYLTAGQTQDVVIPVTVTDNAGATSTRNLTITVTGTNDAAVIGGQLANFVTEDAVVSTGGMLRAGGQLTVVDPDAGEAVFVVQAGVAGVGHYGSFSIDASGHYSYIADNTQAAIQRLKAGETLTDRFTVATADGTQQVVTITINGAEDRPVLQAQTHAVSEDGARLTGKMLATDVDAGDTQRFSVAHPVAGFVLNPDGSFSFNPATASYQHLAAGQTQDVVIPVTVIDSAGGTSTQNLTITVTGKNDGATISGVNTVSTAEDNGQAVTGQLTVADVDDGQAHFVAQSGSAGTYGTFSLNEQGQWSYALDNGKASVQALKTGDSVTDSFTVTSADGTSHQVTVTVTGKNDGALIGGADTASVTEDASVTAGKLEAQGQLTITDLDAGQNHFTAQSNVAGTYGTFSIDQAGHWTYSADNSQGAVQQLKAGDSLIDSMTIPSADGTTHTLLVAIQGSNDAPILTAQAQSVTEDGARLTGKMVATDVDQGDTQAFSTQNPPAGFTLNPDGSYSFDPADSAYQHLGLGQPQVISIPVTVTDSTGLTSTKNLVITITGSNDAPQLAPTPVKILEGAAPIQGQLTATDPDTGDTLTYRAYGPVAGFTLNPDGSFSFDPAHAAYNTLGAGQERVVSIPVTVVDGHGGSTTQNLDITVTGTNDGPAITATPQTVKEGDALLKGQLVGTDADSGDTLTYSTTAKPDGFTLNADGSYTFDPAHAAYDDIGLGQTRVLTIPMTVSDGHGDTATQRLQITVIGTNDAPIMVAEPARTTTEDSAILHGQLSATDPDHADTLTYRATATVPGFLINPDGSYTFNPGNGAYNHLAAGQTQVLSIPVEVTDGHGGTGTQTLQISITGADDGPSFVIAGTRSATEGGPVLTGQFTATDPDSGDTLTYASGAQVAGFALNADGSYTFDPSHADYDSLGIGHSKTVSVPITVTDSQGQSVTQTLRITIAGSNDNPTVSAVAPSTVAEDSSVLQGRLTIADVDAGDTLTCRTSATVAGFNLNPNGSYTFDPSNHTYDHLAPGDSEVLSIPVTVSDGHGGAATQTLQITITGSNDGPALTVVDQTVSEGAAALHGQFAGTDPDRGDTLTYSTSATVAGFTLNPDGSYSFDAAHAAYNSLGVGHSQVVSIPVTVTDSHGATATRSLQITVEGTDDAPVLTATPRSVNEGDASIQGRLTATDPDVGDALTYSTTATIAGFRLTPDGSYTFDPSNAAYNSLAAGTSQDVTVPVTLSDGHGGTTTQNLVITVAGVNDAAHISGARTGTVTEDTAATAGKITTTGTLTVTDPDVGQDHFNALVSNGHYGVFTLDAAGQWTYSADNSKPEIQQLKAGATLTDSFTVTSADGTAHTVTVTVAGSNDAPVLQAQTQAVTEDGTQLTGQIVATDVDAGDTKAFSMANSVDGFTLNADGSYQFDPSHASYQHLAAGQTQDVVIPITVTDSAGATSTQNLTITVTGANDGAVIGGVNVGRVTEDTAVTTGQLQASGQLTLADVDSGEAHFNAQADVAGSAGYGHFSLDTAGAWTYTADNTQTAVQQLKAGDSLTDTLTVTSADGTSHTVTVTLQGTNDAPVLQAQTQAVTEDGSQLTGHMVATDVDAGDTQAFSIANAVDGFSLNADGSYSFDPGHASYQHLAAGQTQDVVIPITVTDSAGAISTQNLTITLTGSNDAPSITGVDAGRVVEDQTLSVSGQLAISDADDGQAHFVAQTAAAGSYGSLTIGEDGQWQYQLDNSKPEVQALKSTETATDTFTVHSADGSSHSITITIQGQRDNVVIGGVDVGVVKENVSTVTGGHLVATGESAEFVPLQQRTTLGDFSMDADGAWTYTLDNSRIGTQALKAGETATETVTITHTDGSTHSITISVMGTNDAPVLSAQTQAVTEDGTQLTGHLVATDADHGDTQTFSHANTVDGFTLNADGSYSFDPSHASYQHLAAGQTQDVVIPITVTDSTGLSSTQNLTITLTGSNDGATIAGTDSGTVTEDSHIASGKISTSGTLTVIDPDAGQDHFNALVSNGHYGVFTLDAAGQWTYSADNSKPEIQQLKAGATLTDSFTVISADGTAHTVTVTVAGSNDAPVLVAQAQAVTEDGAQLQGLMVVTDVDAGDTKAFSLANAVDGFTLNADGSYRFDPSHASYQHLAAGQTQDVVIPITVTDSAGATSTQNLTITVTGANDGAVIGGVSIGSVTEDTSVQNGQLQASGQLTITDTDTGEAHFAPQSDVAAAHGLFSMNATGHWTYTADNTQAAIQQLKAGESLTDTLTVTSADGATHSVTVTIQGTNDSPMLAAQTQAVTEDGTQLSGHLTATDVDAGDTQTFSLANAVDGFTLNADGSYQFDPAHASYQHLAAGQTQDVVIPITVTDSTGATSTQNLMIAITGTNDGATISGVSTGAATEDSQQAVTGQLTIVDLDDGQAHFTAESNTAGSYGSLTLSEDGQWSYQLDNSKPEVQALKSTETATDTFTVHSTDGSSHSITVTIQGQRDSVVIGGVDVGVVKEDVSPLTGGHLVATGESAEFVPVSSLRTTLGEFSMDADGAWSYTLGNSATSAQALKDGETTTDIVSITHTDGTTHTITITVMGTNDAPVLAAQTQAVTEDGSQLSGHLVATDADAGDTQAFSMTNAVDGFTLNADGSYSFDPSHASYQQLAAGQTQDLVIPITVTDSTGLASTQNLTITITGANDGAVIAGHDYNELIEDIRVQPGNLLVASGDLTIADPDAGENHFIAQTDVVGRGGFGHFSIAADGQWHYSADNGQSAVQGLKPGDPHLIDTLVVTSADGTTHTLTVSIQGMNDAPVLAAQTQAVTEDGTQLSGHMVATDADTRDTQSFSIASAVDGFTLNTDGSYSFDPGHASYQHLTAGQTQDIVIPVTVTDSTGLTATQNLTITLTGANDGPLVAHATAATAADLGEVNEDTPRFFTEAELLQAVGATDPDDGSTLHIVAGSLTSAHGTFSGDAAHGFTFTPSANFSGQDVDLQFSVTDGTLAREAHAQLDLAPVVDAPLLSSPAAAQRSDFEAGHYHYTSGSVMLSPSLFGWSADASSVEIGPQHTFGGSSTPDEVLVLRSDASANIYRDLHLQAGQVAHFALDVSSRSHWAVASLEVLWEGRVIDTITPSSAYATHTHAYELVGSGGEGRLELRAVGHGDARVVLDNLDLGTPSYVSGVNQPLRLDLSPYLKLADTDGSETLTAVVEGLPAGFSLSDGVHSVTLASAGQVIELPGWDIAALTVQAPKDFQGELALQLSARTQEGGSAQTISSAQVPLHLRFEQPTVLEDAPQTFSAAKLLALAGLHAPAGASYSLSDVQVDPAFGHFSHDDHGHWTFTPAANVNADQVPFTLTVSGGAQPITSTLQLAITPVNDAPVLTAQSQALDGGGTLYRGHMSATDADVGDALSFSTTATVAGFTLHADGSYQFDPSDAAYQHLATGQSQNAVIPITVTDSAGATSTQNLTFTVTSAAHGAVISGVDSGSLSEDGSSVVASGQLSIVDPDAGEAHFIAQANVSAQHGHFSLQDNGAWTYTLDNKDAAVQALKAGESFTEHLTVSSADGTTHLLTVTVQGSNDSPVLQAQSQSVTEDGSLLRGQMVAQDADHGDALRFSSPNAVGGFTLNADGSYSFDPSHHDYQSLGAGQTRDIAIPITVTDSAGAAATQTLNIHITGRDDRTSIYGVDSGSVQAGVHPETSGDLHASDDDAGQSGFRAGTVNGSFGSLSIDVQGHWTYRVDGNDSFVMHLLPNSHITEQVTVHSVDGTAHDIEIEVSGPPGGSQLSAPQDIVDAQHVVLPQVWDAYQVQTGASQGGHEVFAGIQAAVRAAGYQYQGLADELDKGSLASLGNLDLSITGVHVQVVDKFGQVVQSILPTAENAATLHVSDLLLWHAQGHSIVATSDSGLDSTHMWLHNSGDLHSIQVSLPNGTGFNGWVGEYTFGELSLTAQPPAPSPAPPAADDFGPQHDDPTPSVDDLQVGGHAAVVVDLSHSVSPANTHHEAAAPAQGDALNDAGLDVHSAGTTGGAADSYSPVADYLQFAGSAMPSAAMGEHSGTSNPAVHEYLAAAGIDSLTPTADDMHMPPTAVLMDLQHAGVSGEHTAANEQSVDPVADDLAAIENPLADDPNQHHGGI